MTKQTSTGTSASTLVLYFVLLVIIISVFFYQNHSISETKTNVSAVRTTVDTDVEKVAEIDTKVSLLNNTLNNQYYTKDKIDALTKTEFQTEVVNTTDNKKVIRILPRGGETIGIGKDANDNSIIELDTDGMIKLNGNINVARGVTDGKNNDGFIQLGNYGRLYTQTYQTNKRTINFAYLNGSDVTDFMYYDAGEATGKLKFSRPVAFFEDVTFSRSIVAPQQSVYNIPNISDMTQRSGYNLYQSDTNATLVGYFKNISDDATKGKLVIGNYLTGTSPNQVLKGSIYIEKPNSGAGYVGIMNDSPLYPLDIDGGEVRINNSKSGYGTLIFGGTEGSTNSRRSFIQSNSSFFMIGASVYTSSWNLASMLIQCDLTNFTTTLKRTIVQDSTASTSTSTGALTVTGGVGVAGDVFASNVRTAGRLVSFGSQTSGGLELTGDIASAQWLVSLAGDSQLGFFRKEDGTNYTKKAYINQNGLISANSGFRAGQLDMVEIDGAYSVIKHPSYIDMLTQYYQVFNYGLSYCANAIYTGLDNAGKGSFHRNFTEQFDVVSATRVQEQLYSIFNVLTAVDTDNRFGKIRANIERFTIQNNPRYSGATPTKTPVDLFVVECAAESTAASSATITTNVGAFTMNGAGTFQVNPASTFTNTVSITNSTPSVSKTTGALIVSGGVGVNGTLSANDSRFNKIQIGNTKAFLGDAGYDVSDCLLCTNDYFSVLVKCFTIWNTALTFSFFIVNPTEKTMTTRVETVKFLDFTSGTSLIEFDTTAGKGDIRCFGNVYTGATFSDKRIKSNITPVSHETALRALDHIDIVSYMNNRESIEGKHIQFGVIAQQISEHFPELINPIKSFTADICQYGTIQSIHEKIVTIVFDKPIDLVKGNRIQFVDTIHPDGRLESSIDSISDDSLQITVTAWNESITIGHTIYVFGKEIEDVLTVQKQEIGIIALAGAKALHHENEQMKSELCLMKIECREMKEENENIKNENKEMKNELCRMKSEYREMKQEMEAMKQLLMSLLPK